MTTTPKKKNGTLKKARKKQHVPGSGKTGRVNKKAAPKKKATKKNDGRGNKKTVITDDQKKQLMIAAASGCTYNEMALWIGISQDTLRRAREEQSGVQNVIDGGKAKGAVKAKNRLFDIGVNTPPSKFKQVHLNALTYFLNNNTEFSTQLELNEGTAIPKDVDINDEEAVSTYLAMIKKPD